MNVEFYLLIPLYLYSLTSKFLLNFGETLEIMINPNYRLLVISTSTIYGSGYLEYIREEIIDFLQTDELLFIPFARPSGISYDAYTANVEDALSPFGIKVTGVHTYADPKEAVRKAKAIFIGGGNTFLLLKTLYELGLVDVLREVVVTRYFGGIKLGTGGLSRAYTTAAKMGLESSGICEIREGCLLTYTFNYSSLDKLQNLARDGRFEIKDIEYADKVKSTLSCMLENVSDIKSMMDDLTSGQAVLTAEENALNKYKI